MKPIHKVVSKDELRPAMMHIQVKEGQVYATNAHVLIKLPVEEVFGENIIANDEELYFLGSLWAASKMDKAASVERDGLIFYSKNNKGLTIGTIVAVTADKINGQYPAVNVVIPTIESAKDIPCIGINPLRLVDLCSAISSNMEAFRYVFFGQTKSTIVINTESKGLGLIMPCYKQEDRESELDKHPFYNNSVDDLL
jgi:hypothetical protein